MDLRWLRSLTRLPILLKGIQYPDDVRRAKDYGMDGVYCSNHGGRQADGGLPALDAPASRRRRRGRNAGAVRLRHTQRFRRGQALALGATALGIGRPYAYALAIGGTEGVVSQLRAILAELDLLRPSMASAR
jgi:lactate 2-monooxygenase